MIGNVGALAQRSLKRLLAWSSVAQAGYLLAGVVVGTALGLQATVFYLAVYLVMNVAAFAVVIARERVSEHGDDLASLENLGRPALAGVADDDRDAVAGRLPGHRRLHREVLFDRRRRGGRLRLARHRDRDRLGDLARLLPARDRGDVDGPRRGRAADVPPRRVKPVSGWSPEADARAQPEVAAMAILFGGATIFFGIWPEPLFDAARDVGTSLSGPALAAGGLEELDRVAGGDRRAGSAGRLGR